MYLLEGRDTCSEGRRTNGNRREETRGQGRKGRKDGD